ncbi:MAG: hypothetical protein U0103_23120 [Candidatus Obscuribacterales bacterium]
MTSKNQEPKILQVLNSKGWFALYKVDSSCEASPLCGWALVETINEAGDTARELVGLDADCYVDFCTSMENFVMYAHSSQLEERLALLRSEFGKQQKLKVVGGRD